MSIHQSLVTEGQTISQAEDISSLSTRPRIRCDFAVYEYGVQSVQTVAAPIFWQQPERVCYRPGEIKPVSDTLV
jgi:hypothetical protein